MEFTNSSDSKSETACCISIQFGDGNSSDVVVSDTEAKRKDENPFAAPRMPVAFQKKSISDIKTSTELISSYTLNSQVVGSNSFRKGLNATSSKMSTLSAPSAVASSVKTANMPKPAGNLGVPSNNLLSTASATGK